MTIAAIIEWSSSDPFEPVLVLTPSLETTCATVVEFLRDEHSPDCYADAKDFITDNPYPNTTDHEAVRTWLLAMREATTAPWVELYMQDGPIATHMPMHAILGDD